MESGPYLSELAMDERNPSLWLANARSATPALFPRPSAQDDYAYHQQGQNQKDKTKLKCATSYRCYGRDKADRFVHSRCLPDWQIAVSSIRGSPKVPPIK
jgi:hypothetical protein